VYLATSATTYASAVSYTTSDGVYNTCSLTSGDLSGDGKPEVVASNCNADTVTVYVNNGDGSFQTGVYCPVALNQPNGTNADVYSEAVSIGDVNGDGKADILSEHGWRRHHGSARQWRRYVQLSHGRLRNGWVSRLAGDHCGLRRGWQDRRNCL
jgi:hypothetical protein